MDIRIPHRNKTKTGIPGFRGAEEQTNAIPRKLAVVIKCSTHLNTYYFFLLFLHQEKNQNLYGLKLKFTPTNSPV